MLYNGEKITKFNYKILKNAVIHEHIDSISNDFYIFEHRRYVKKEFLKSYYHDFCKILPYYKFINGLLIVNLSKNEYYICKNDCNNNNIDSDKTIIKKNIITNHKNIENTNIKFDNVELKFNNNKKKEFYICFMGSFDLYELIDIKNNNNFVKNIAYIPNLETSKYLKKYFSENNEKLKIICEYNEYFKKWKPIIK